MRVSIEPVGQAARVIAPGLKEKPPAVALVGLAAQAAVARLQSSRNAARPSSASSSM
jgi:hypothetical protein